MKAMMLQNATFSINTSECISDMLHSNRCSISRCVWQRVENGKNSLSL